MDLFGRKPGMHIISMLDVDCIKKQLDQIKVMMNKTTQQQARPMKDSA